ncbi:MAG: hypothetical protein ACJ71P_15245 [Nitrososphaeraceae archaeon]
MPPSFMSYGVRITLPVKGQQVPAATTLKISWTSRDNTISDCHVIVNDVKMLQQLVLADQMTTRRK